MPVMTGAGPSTGSYDFGTVPSPGGNLFQSNSVPVAGNTQGYFAVGGATLINAIGNTWMPSAGGADAAGHYAVGPSGYTESSGSQGPNYTLEQFGGGACFIRL